MIFLAGPAKRVKTNSALCIALHHIRMEAEKGQGTISSKCVEISFKLSGFLSNCRDVFQTVEISFKMLKFLSNCHVLKNHRSFPESVAFPKTVVFLKTVAFPKTVALPKTVMFPKTVVFPKTVAFPESVVLPQGYI